MIQNGEIGAVSIEGMYLDDSNNTSKIEYPTSLHFEALALLTSDDLPGDPDARILREFVPPNQVRIPAVITESIMMTNFSSVNTADSEWSTAQVNDLPDSSFAYVEPGGSKDGDSKTTPRSLRHLPYKGTDGKPDAPHVRNALAQLSQTDIPDSAKDEAHGKLSAAAKELGIEMSETKALEKLRVAKQAMDNYSAGLISKATYKLLLKEMGLDADDDAIVQKGVGLAGKDLQQDLGDVVQADPVNQTPSTKNTSHSGDYPVGRRLAGSKPGQWRESKRRSK